MLTFDAPPEPRRDSGPVALDDVACRAVLARVGWGVLATLGEDGPYGVPVGYALGADCVYVASGSGQKRRNLEVVRRVCLTVCDVDTFDRWQSVVVQGEAVPVEGLGARAVAMTAFIAQRAPRGRPGATDVKRLVDAYIVRLPLAGMTGRARGTP